MPKFSRRFDALPKYALADVPRIKAQLIEQGVDVIDLGAGDADLMPPASVVSLKVWPAWGPGSTPGWTNSRKAEWMQERFDVTLDPYDEVLPLIGTKEGIAHLPLIYLEDGDAGIVPDPGYYPYFGGTHMVGAEVVRVPLRAETGFLLDWEEVPADKLRRAKLLFLN